MRIDIGVDVTLLTSSFKLSLLGKPKVYIKAQLAKVYGLFSGPDHDHQQALNVVDCAVIVQDGVVIVYIEVQGHGYAHNKYNGNVMCNEVRVQDVSRDGDIQIKVGRENYPLYAVLKENTQISKQVLVLSTVSSF